MNKLKLVLIIFLFAKFNTTNAQTQEGNEAKPVSENKESLFVIKAGFDFFNILINKNKYFERMLHGENLEESLEFGFGGRHSIQLSFIRSSKNKNYSNYDYYEYFSFNSSFLKKTIELDLYYKYYLSSKKNYSGFYSGAAAIYRKDKNELFKYGTSYETTLVYKSKVHYLGYTTVFGYQNYLGKHFCYDLSILLMGGVYLIKNKPIFIDEKSVNISIKDPLVKDPYRILYPETYFDKSTLLFRIGYKF